MDAIQHPSKILEHAAQHLRWQAEYSYSQTERIADLDALCIVNMARFDVAFPVRRK